MSFRARLTLVAAGAVAVAVVIASAITYAVVRNQLRGQFDDSLRSRAASVRVGIDGDNHGCLLLSGRPSFGEAPFAVQFVEPNGGTCLPRFFSVGGLPVSSRDRKVATGGGGEYFRDVTISGAHVRLFTSPAFDPTGALVGAVQVGRSLDEVDHALDRIRTLLVLIALGGVAGAATLGLVIARTALAPVRRLTQAAEEVTETRDLSRRIDDRGRDELSRLAATFNTMLAALEDSARAQRQLVADASHELRTPLTSLRTNIEVLARSDQLPATDREHLLRDVTEQLTEMTALVAELVELARGDLEPADAEDVRLDLVVADAIERTERNHPRARFRPRLEESLVRGVRSTIERAVSNLLDNAAKWSPPDGEIEVIVHAGEVSVRDQGPGIDAADLPFVFDRFYRAANARGMPGSGLGLAIVRQVAEAHGGSVAAETADGGGTRIRLMLPAQHSPATAS
jgi:two-component system, OmpR family, sensor histidine kinase MprB